MPQSQRKIILHFFGLAIGLFAIWILLSGRFEARFLIIGAVSSLGISFLCLPFLMITNLSSGKAFFVFRVHYLRFFVYTGWLLKEIFKSTYDVCKVIMKPGTDYVPRIVYFSMPYENPMASVILANSIILTPGTVTIDVTDDGIFEVHALHKTAADDMLSGTMPRKVAWVFGETCEFVPLPEMEITDINVEGL